MIKVYGMPSCPDCSYVEEQIKDREGFEVIDIGSDVKKLKEFLKLRDTDPAFDSVKGQGVGIPCFVTEDGKVTLNPEDVGLKPRSDQRIACRIDGKGC